MDTRVLPLVPWDPPLTGTQLSYDQAPNLPKQPGKEALCQNSVHTRDTEVRFREAGTVPRVTQLSNDGARFYPPAVLLQSRALNPLIKGPLLLAWHTQ